MPAYTFAVQQMLRVNTAGVQAMDAAGVVSVGELNVTIAPAGRGRRVRSAQSRPKLTRAISPRKLLRSPGWLLWPIR